MTTSIAGAVTAQGRDIITAVKSDCKSYTMTPTGRPPEADRPVAATMLQVLHKLKYGLKRNSDRTNEGLRTFGPCLALLFQHGLNSQSPELWVSGRRRVGETLLISRQLGRQMKAHYSIPNWSWLPS